MEKYKLSSQDNDNINDKTWDKRAHEKYALVRALRWKEDS